MLLLAAFLSILPFLGTPPAPGAAPADYVVGPQDVLDIVVFGEADLTKTIALDADGTFDFPHIGRVRAGGLTARRIAEVIAAKLMELYVNPQVSVEVSKFRSQNVFVFGQVRSPGQYPLTGNMSVLQVLAAAGSPTAAAASYMVISRPAGSEPPLPDKEPGGGTSLRITMKELQGGLLPAMSVLRDGDTVTIPKADTVYVTGHVKSPGPYIVEVELTVMQVIAMAGGVSERGAVNRVRIFRTVDGRLQTVQGVRLSDRVKPGDTIDVPQRFF